MRYKISNRVLFVVIAVVILLPLATPSLAVEGGFGRSISGMQIAPFAAVVPPEPGFALSVGEIYYSGSIGAGRTVPIAGLLVANVDVKASFSPITLLYIWPTPTKEWNLASAVVRSGFYSHRTESSLQRD
jgi:hypothetical protein